MKKESISRVLAEVSVSKSTEEIKTERNGESATDVKISSSPRRRMFNYKRLNKNRRKK